MAKKAKKAKKAEKTGKKKVTITSLVLAYWNEATGEWEQVNGSTVDQLNNTVTAWVNHFSTYGVLEGGSVSPIKNIGTSESNVLKWRL